MDTWFGHVLAFVLDLLNLKTLMANQMVMKHFLFLTCMPNMLYMASQGVIKDFWFTHWDSFRSIGMVWVFCGGPISIFGSNWCTG